MGARFGYWITEMNRRESEKPAQVIDGTAGFIPSVGCPCSRKGFDRGARFHPDFKGKFGDFRCLFAHRFDGSIGNIWHMWNQLVATVYRRANLALGGLES